MSMRVLERLICTAKVTEFIIMVFQSVMGSIKQKGIQVEISINAAGWEETIRLGLHTFSELQRIVHEATKFPGLRLESSTRSRNPTTH